MALRGEILEYPYTGTIYRVVQGKGDSSDEEILLYEGVMDEHQMEHEVGHMLQTASYIICMPLTKDANGEWIVPRKGDKISLIRYGERMLFEVDNAEPSQLGGISIYAARQSWSGYEEVTSSV